MTLSVTLAEQEFEDLARTLSLWARPGLIITLSGDLGSGKSTFARAFLRALANSNELDVQSPTFPLIQTYTETRIAAAHVDLYRIKERGEIEELGLGELLGTHVILVEWPALLPQLTDDVLAISLSGAGQTRDIMLQPHGRWVQSLARNAEIEDFLARHHLEKTSRRFLEGDASSRRYELVTDADGTHVLMDMPDRPDGPIVKHGKTYSALVHLAENINAVIGVNNYLKSLGYSAPATRAVDGAAGLAVMERLDGDVHGTMMRRGDDMREPLSTAIAVLADMATKPWPKQVPGAPQKLHVVPDYDREAQMVEVELMPMWFWPQLFNAQAPEPVTASFDAVWRELLPQVPLHEAVWVLRDFHSPNLIWMPQRQGLERTGIIDTQDAMIGHAAYDVVSLLQDARVDVAFDVQDQLLDHYISLRLARGGFDEIEFRQSYAILGAQRATRLLGTFTRLSKRDGKHQYLQHRPRVARYLARNLRHSALLDLRRWYEINLPQVLELAKQ
jgi:N-acetylmuramate 1-kinase